MGTSAGIDKWELMLRRENDRWIDLLSSAKPTAAKSNVYDETTTMS
jgi:hypothetical protein